MAKTSNPLYRRGWRGLRTQLNVHHTYRNLTTIKIKSTPERPVKIKPATVVRKQYLHDDAWWFSFHRSGIHRGRVGVSPYEARAIPSSIVSGTLPERIMYKALLIIARIHPSDIDFQSSLSGGRLELGGIMADFVLPHYKMIIQVQGPTHTGYIRRKKDEEQNALLEEMGFKVYEIDQDTVLNEYALEEWIRRVFNFTMGWGSGGGVLAGSLATTKSQISQSNSEDNIEQDFLLSALNIAKDIYDTLSSIHFLRG